MFYKYYRTGHAENWTLQILLDSLKIDRHCKQRPKLAFEDFFSLKYSIQDNGPLSAGNRRNRGPLLSEDESVLDSFSYLKRRITLLEEP